MESMLLLAEDSSSGHSSDMGVSSIVLADFLTTFILSSVCCDAFCAVYGILYSYFEVTRAKSSCGRFPPAALSMVLRLRERFFAFWEERFFSFFLLLLYYLFKLILTFICIFIATFTEYSEDLEVLRVGATWTGKAAALGSRAIRLCCGC